MIVRWWKVLEEELKNNVLDSFLKDEDIDKSFTKNSQSTLRIGKDTFISKDAKINGNVVIGRNCMIGTNVVIRGNVKICDNVRLGYGVEVKDSIIRENTTIGPLSYLGNSLVEKNVYLGALVRTSNHRLDKSNIKSWNGEYLEDTNLEKLGAWIKENTRLGIAVVILPGRIVPENSIFSPHIVIVKNYAPGEYRLTQNISQIVKEKNNE